jgi:hypothetical protein
MRTGNLTIESRAGGSIFGSVLLMAMLGVADAAAATSEIDSFQEARTRTLLRAWLHHCRRRCGARCDAAHRVTRNRAAV